MKRFKRKREVKNLAKVSWLSSWPDVRFRSIRTYRFQRKWKFLKDDRNSNTKELYKEAADVQKKELKMQGNMIFSQKGRIMF